MKQREKEKFRGKDIKDLEKEIKKLELELIKFRGQSKGWGFSPKSGSPTTAIKKLKKNIAVLKTIVNEKCDTNLKN